MQNFTTVIRILSERFSWRLSLSLSPGREIRTREMAVDSPAGVIIIATVLLHAVTTLVCGSDAVLKLERVIPPNHELGLTELRAFDSARHGRLLQSPVGGVVNFPVDGASDPFLVGYYYCCYPFAFALFRFRFSNFSLLFGFQRKKSHRSIEISGLGFGNFPPNKIELK